MLSTCRCRPIDISARKGLQLNTKVGLEHMVAIESVVKQQTRDCVIITEQPEIIEACGKDDVEQIHITENVEISLRPNYVTPSTRLRYDGRKTRS